MINNLDLTLALLPDDWASTAHGRRTATRDDPLLFAWTYLAKHVTLDDEVSFSSVHLDWAEQAKRWMAKDVTRDIYIAPRSLGKALDVTTPVLTHNRGWVKHGDLVVGDQVYDENGEPCSVTHVAQWADRPCYRVEFVDGTHVIADENHEWLVEDRYRSVKSGCLPGPRVRETKWMASRVRSGARGDARFSVALTKGYVGNHLDLPVDPYVLGVWLGDGHSAGGRVTVSDQDQIELEHHLVDAGEIVHSARQPNGNWTFQLWGSAPPEFWSTGRRHPDSTVQRLRRAEVLNNKHVPDQYFLASYEQRLALFQGLMDTDGCVTSAGVCEFTQKAGVLAEDVLRLAQGLGIKATIGEYDMKLNGRIVGRKQRVHFTTSLPVFRLARKLARVRTSLPPTCGRRFITNVTEVTPRTTNCISVDSASRLYCVTEAMIPTHNSTWFYLLLPMWAAAHGHVKFALAVSDSATQAETHLSTFRHELETNQGLREDFPDLCKPATRSRGVAVADNRSMLQTKSGFAFVARGIDSGNLGTKVMERRPDLLLLDDVEPGAANYSTFQAEKRLATITDVILPLNDRARVAMVGTTVMHGSIVHQAVQHAVQPALWVSDEKFQVHHALPFDDAGESIWPERWSTEHLRSIQGHRSFALNFLNQPMNTEGNFWSKDDITLDSMPFYPRRTIISIDPAVTKKRTSDYTGIAVLSHDPSQNKVYVRKVWKVKLSPKELKWKVSAILNEFPETRVLLAETNQGGDAWADVFGDLEVQYREVKQTIKKEDRALVLLNGYQKREVVHVETLPDLEAELLAFPNGLNDDLVDAVGSGVQYFTGAGISQKSVPRNQARVRSMSYI